MLEAIMEFIGGFLGERWTRRRKAPWNIALGLTTMTFLLASLYIIWEDGAYNPEDTLFIGYFMPGLFLFLWAASHHELRKRDRTKGGPR